MEIISIIGGFVLIAFFIYLPISWVWVLYHKIKCRKVEDCKNRKCSYWGMCDHNRAEYQKDMMLKRLEMAEIYSGEDLSELKNKINGGAKNGI